MKPYPSQYIQADYNAHMALQSTISEIPGSLMVAQTTSPHKRKLYCSNADGKPLNPYYPRKPT
eukprot:12318571-Ditylum_brightwellii.AAC.1